MKELGDSECFKDGNFKRSPKVLRYYRAYAIVDLYQYWKDEGPGVELVLQVVKRLAHHDVPVGEVFFIKIYTVKNLE